MKASDKQIQELLDSSGGVVFSDKSTIYFRDLAKEIKYYREKSKNRADIKQPLQPDSVQKPVAC